MTLKAGCSGQGQSSWNMALQLPENASMGFRSNTRIVGLQSLCLGAEAIPNGVFRTRGAVGVKQVAFRSRMRMTNRENQVFKSLGTKMTSSNSISQHHCLQDVHVQDLDILPWGNQFRYIGGSVLARLLSRPDAVNYEITALVRDPVKAKNLESFGVKTVIGSFTESPLVSQLAEHAHVVFSCADCDDVGLAQAILAGLKKRNETLGDVPIVIHTSGTAEVAADSRGKADTEIYDDSNVDQIKNISIHVIHRKVSVAYVEADLEG
ncbi:hypothetical protein NM688_g4212 [Phlebia brevispora]|uniref:Uncharacterized protein n=1 Tax=Phlebia brevispora TaxID=194682 RepID=A0ACC1T3J3_9APHY|nr:hypothetical protein NM688_g4212 [Phlebia brevispora]